MAAENEGREVESTEDSYPGGRTVAAEAYSENGRTAAPITHSASSTHDDGVRHLLAEESHITEMARPVERSTGHTSAPRQGGMDGVGLLFAECIEEVSRLEVQREESIQELLRLHRPMLWAVEALRAECEGVRRLLTLAQLDCVSLQEEAQQVKRRLFATVRDCIHSQVTLAAQQYEVAQYTVTQEELQNHLQNLTQEVAELQEAQQNQLNTLRERARKPGRPRTTSDLSQVRRASLSLQRRLSGSVRSLEGWYEPRLLALLRRRQSVEEVLRRTREAGQDLRVQLGPLREEWERLELQRACLEERIALTERDREENVVQYKVTMEALEETIGDLKLELQVQKKSKTSLEELKNDLLRELEFHRGCRRMCEKNPEEGDG